MGYFPRIVGCAVLLAAPGFVGVSSARPRDGMDFRFSMGSSFHQKMVWKYGRKRGRFPKELISVYEVRYRASPGKTYIANFRCTKPGEFRFQLRHKTRSDLSIVLRYPGGKREHLSIRKGNWGIFRISWADIDQGERFFVLIKNKGSKKASGTFHYRRVKKSWTRAAEKKANFEARENPFGETARNRSLRIRRLQARLRKMTRKQGQLEKRLDALDAMQGKLQRVEKRLDALEGRARQGSEAKPRRP